MGCGGSHRYKSIRRIDLKIQSRTPAAAAAAGGGGALRPASESHDVAGDPLPNWQHPQCPSRSRLIVHFFQYNPTESPFRPSHACTQIPIHHLSGTTLARTPLQELNVALWIRFAFHLFTSFSIKGRFFRVFYARVFNRNYSFNPNSYLFALPVVFFFHLNGSFTLSITRFVIPNSSSFHFVTQFPFTIVDSRWSRIHCGWSQVHLRTCSDWLHPFLISDETNAITMPLTRTRFVYGNQLKDRAKGCSNNRVTRFRPIPSIASFFFWISSGIVGDDAFFKYYSLDSDRQKRPLKLKLHFPLKVCFSHWLPYPFNCPHTFHEKKELS